MPNKKSETKNSFIMMLNDKDNMGASTATHIIALIMQLHSLLANLTPTIGMYRTDFTRWESMGRGKGGRVLFYKHRSCREV